MTTIFLIRHGESLSNTQGIFGGRIDVPLTEKGKKQAERLRAFLAETPLNAVYASPLSRATDTAAPLAAAHHLTVQPAPGLIEMDVGDWGGQSGDAIHRQFPAECAAWVNHPETFSFPHGENFRQVEDRAVASLTALIAAHPGERFAVITHGGVIRSLECHFRGMPLTQLRTIPYVGNASVTRLEAEDGRIRCCSHGEDSFLADLATYMAKVV